MVRRRTQPRFDWYAILKALERESVGYVIVGAFVRVLVGAEELTRGIDIAPTDPENLRRRDLALEEAPSRRPRASGADDRLLA